MVLANLVHQGEMKEAGSLDLTPVRSGGSIRHQVDTELSLGGLNSSVGGSGRDLEVKKPSVSYSLQRRERLPGIPE